MNGCMYVLHGLVNVNVSSRAALCHDVVDIYCTLYATHVMLLLRLYTISDMPCCMQFRNSGSTKNQAERMKLTDLNTKKYTIKYLVLIYQCDYINFFNGVAVGYHSLSELNALSSSILM